MLPSGPRYTFGIPSTPQLNTRQLATQILASMQGQIAASTELKVGTVSTGCDGLPTINPLNGTTCPGTQPGTARSLALYHPLTPSLLYPPARRSLSSSAGACARGSVASPAGISSAYAHPADC